MADGVRVIVTDIGSVLFRFDPDLRLGLLAERTGRSAAELHGLLFASGFETECEAGRYSPDEIRDEVAARTGFDGDVDELSRLWTSAFTVDDEVMEILVAAELPLAIFSNNGPLFADFFDVRFPEVAKWFRHRYFASRMKVRKPEPGAFAVVEQRVRHCLAAEPQHVLFIDDSRANTAAAAARGWQVHTFTTPQALRTLLNP
jgi:HAD superfamily hydrolase (TIGR01509 family)